MRHYNGKPKEQALMIVGHFLEIRKKVNQWITKSKDLDFSFHIEKCSVLLTALGDVQ